MFNLADPGETNFDLRFNVLGFPVRVHPLFWLIAVILGARGFPSGGGPQLLIIVLLWVAVVFISILIHELGHCLAMRFYGSRARIVLYAMGGLAIPESSSFQPFGRASKRSTTESIVISAAGPVAGFLLAGLVIGIIFAAGGKVEPQGWFGWYIELRRGQDNQAVIAADPKAIYVWMFLEYMLWVNIMWGLINLLPVMPLDGGQIARAIFTHFDPWNGLANSLWFSVAVGAGMAAVGMLVFNSLFIALMFGMLAFSSWQMLQQLGGGGFGGGGRPW